MSGEREIFHNRIIAQQKSMQSERIYVCAEDLKVFVPEWLALRAFLFISFSSRVKLEK
jgi:hypothetical protein